MMINYVKIGGQERPIAFGHAVAYDYQDKTGENFNALLIQVSEMFALSAQAMTDAENVPDVELEDAALFLGQERRKTLSTFSVKPMTDVVYYGLLFAHRRKNVPVDFEAADVAEWLFDDNEALTACLRLLMDSLPKAPEDAEAKKKPAPSKQAKQTRKSAK